MRVFSMSYGDTARVGLRVLPYKRRFRIGHVRIGAPRFGRDEPKIVVRIALVSSMAAFSHRVICRGICSSCITFSFITRGSSSLETLKTKLFTLPFPNDKICFSRHTCPWSGLPHVLYDTRMRIRNVCFTVAGVPVHSIVLPVQNVGEFRTPEPQYPELL